MDRNKEIAERLSTTGFLEELLGMMIGRGFGVLPAREVAIETLNLMLKHHPDWRRKPPSAYELARILRSSPRKIRGYLDEISFRDPGFNESKLNDELRLILQSGERIRDGAFVAIEIDDGLVRAYACQLIRDNLGVAEQGNAQTILKLSGRQYATLCLAVFPEEEVKTVLDAFEKEWPNPAGKPDKTKTLASRMVERFAIAASDQAGKKSVDLGFSLLTGGLSDLPDVIQRIRELLQGGSD